MTIRIIEDGPDIILTRGEAERLRKEWQKVCQYNVEPPTFEEFVRSRKASETKVKVKADVVR